MTSEQEHHLQQIKTAFKSAVDVKYRKGQKEHGGNLFDLTSLNLIDAALDECIDQYTYLFTLRDKIKEELRLNVILKGTAKP